MLVATRSTTLGPIKKPSESNLLPAVERHFGTFLLGNVQIARNLIAMLGPNQRAHVDAFVPVGRPNFHQLAHVVDEALNNGSPALPTATATLPAMHRSPGTAKRRRRKRLHGLIQIGIRHDDQMILRPAGRLHALARRGAASRRCTWQRRRTDKRKPAPSDASINASTASLSPCTMLNTPAGTPASVNSSPSRIRRQRHLLRRLQNKRVAARNAPSETSTAAPSPES